MNWWRRASSGAARRSGVAAHDPSSEKSRRSFVIGKSAEAMAMNDDPDSSIVQERAGREATEWLILLGEDQDDAALRARFDAWLSATPANAAAWAETQAITGAIRLVVDRTADPVPDHSAASVIPFPARRWRGRIMAATGLAAAACLAVLALPSLWIAVQADYRAGAGEMTSVALSDGTAVKLAPGAALAVDFTPAERRVRLLRGDAYFDVAHNAARPFRIASGDSVTTVLGTAFEVRRDAVGTAVAVRRGIVRVDCADGSARERLTVGQTLDLACGRAAIRGTIKPARVASWTAGQLVASDQPLRDVVAAIRPWYKGVIVLRGDGEGRRVTGVYDLTHPRAALAALMSAHHGEVSDILPGVVLLTAH